MSSYKLRLIPDEEFLKEKAILPSIPEMRGKLNLSMQCAEHLKAAAFLYKTCLMRFSGSLYESPIPYIYITLCENYKTVYVTFFI